MEITSCHEYHPCIDTNQMTQDVLLIEIEDLLFHSSNFQQIITWYTYYQNQFLCCKMSLNGCFMINNFVPMRNDSLYDHLCCQFTSTVQQLEFVSLFWLLNKDEKPLKKIITGWHYNHSRIRNMKYTYSIRISTVNIRHDGSLSMADDINLYIIPVTFI